MRIALVGSQLRSGVRPLHVRLRSRRARLLYTDEVFVNAVVADLRRHVRNGRCDFRSACRQRRPRTAFVSSRTEGPYFGVTDKRTPWDAGGSPAVGSGRAESLTPRRSRRGGHVWVIFFSASPFRRVLHWTSPGRCLRCLRCLRPPHQPHTQQSHTSPRFAAITPTRRTVQDDSNEANASSCCLWRVPATSPMVSAYRFF